jgi:hypothetical protein
VETDKGNLFHTRFCSTWKTNDWPHLVDRTVFYSIIFFRKPNKHWDGDVEIHGSPTSKESTFSSDTLFIYRLGDKNIGNRGTTSSADHSTYFPGLILRLFNIFKARMLSLRCKTILSRMSPSHMFINAKHWAPLVWPPGSPPLWGWKSIFCSNGFSKRTYVRIRRR